ncbi:PaaD-like zinc ribbon domain-containing protein [Thermus thermophilus]|uniref:PaaD-like zinc ribbon domain-containing protein n=1 Tax=Thermus thermophilus TaxID=274 RepID=UPI004045BB7F
MGRMEQAAKKDRSDLAREVVCPWCGSTRVERLGDFGPQLMGEPYFCLDCRSPFERIRKRGEGGQGTR